MPIEIKTGIIGKDGIKKAVFHELLSQQGILFEDVKQDSSNRYPCIIILDNRTDAESIAIKRCLDLKNIIHVDKIIPLDTLVLAFTGHFEDPYLASKLVQPIISEYGLKILNLTRDCYLRSNIPFIHIWYWPNFADACLIFTHDIDNLVPDSSNRIFSFIRKHIFAKIGIKSSNVVDIADIELKNGINSSFYFFSEYKRQFEFRNILIELKEKGFEIGLHGSLFSFQDINLLKVEKERLSSISETKIKGERQHGLNFLNPHTWRYLEKLNFEYDISLFYNDKFGFRSGICHPYRPFDVLSGKKFNLIEIPTCFMDFTAIHTKSTLNEIRSIINELEKAVFQNNGCFVVNFHNEYLGNKRFISIDKIFKNLLQKASEGKYWIANAKECVEWWKKREFANVFLSEIQGKNFVTFDKDLFIRVYYPDGTKMDYENQSKIML